MDPLTFGLAGLGYLSLAGDTALRLAGRRIRVLAWLTAAIVLTHVALVWATRFEWSAAAAWTKSPPAFVVFHAALALLLVAPFTTSTTRDRATVLAFAVVSAGALPAPFRYPELQMLALPLLGAAGAVVAVALVARARRSTPRQALGLTSLVVRDYDEALAFYCGTLGFELVEDTYVPEQDKRWVVVAPPGGAGSQLLLARAVGAAQTARIGDQTGGRVFLFLYTNDFERDVARYTAAGVEFVRPPRDAPYGRVAVFVDPYGNQWDLLEPSAAHTNAALVHRP